MSRLEEFANRHIVPRISTTCLFPRRLVEERVLVAAQSGKDPSLEPRPTRAPPPVQQPLPKVRFETELGWVILILYEDECPNTVANFISLTEQGKYDGSTFHRKRTNEGNRGFIQGGRPTGTEARDAGYTIEDEPTDYKHVRGTISMARKHDDPNSAGTQFFICLEDQPQLDGTYTVFGRVFRGLDVVDLLEEGALIRRATIVHKRDHPYEPRRITN